MSSREDYYVILGVSRNCSDEELKKAFRKLALQYHPDRNGGDAQAMERFKLINEAYQVLSDPGKRSAYDQFGHAGVNQGQGFGGFDSAGFGASFSDIFDNIFGDIFGQGGRGSSGGMDLRYNLEVDFEEAAFGAEKQINFEKETACEACQGLGAKAGTRPKTCRTCRGTGQVSFNQGVFVLSRKCSTCQGRGAVIEEKCTPCRGKGSIRKPHTLTVKIPAGIDTDQRLRLRNEGEITEPGGRPGDLYVHVIVREHPLFKRENEHVILELPITIVQAALGAEIEIPTLGGTTKLKIQPGTQTGSILRLKGKGICRLNGSGFGDQVVLLSVETPSSLTGRQKELLREFEAEGNAHSQPGIMNFVQRFKEIFKT